MCDKKCNACGIDDQARGNDLCPGCLEEEQNWMDEEMSPEGQHYTNAEVRRNGCFDPPKVIISQEEMDRFLCLRTRIFGLIDKAIEQDGHHKSYEGQISIRWPNRFEDSSGVLSIELACYVLGPSREYYWDGKTLAEALDKMVVDVDIWEHEINQNRNDE